ncbi:MAG: hypothetical protein A2068_04875 [Ignavibacteria bacterium GWB2_35_6b]|nr:MAG: hypothetical protein A2068_04875 [Ignavibacteria bacterium GWB2_35_6b]
MNTGQMMITIGAIMLLTLVIMRVNNGFLSTDEVLMRSKFGVLAVSLATSMIEEANGKAFDNNTDTTSVSTITQLTNTLGPESGETYLTFNDFDDFNNYLRYTATDSTIKSAPFKIFCRVNYINPGSPSDSTATRTWHKKISVEVSSPNMEDTIKMSSVFSYWYFR